MGIVPAESWIIRCGGEDCTKEQLFMAEHKWHAESLAMDAGWQITPTLCPWCRAKGE